jgi:hypothetical protein
MADVRQSSGSKGKPGEETATCANLTVTGRVTLESGGTIGGLLAEAIDVRGRDQLVRLRSTPVNGGSFSMVIQLEDGVAKNRTNLQLRLFAPDLPGVDRKQRLLFESEIREGAAVHEHFEVELSQRLVERAGVGRTASDRTDRSVAAAAAAETERRAAVRKAGEKAFSESLAEVKERRDLFRGKIRGALAESISTVTSRDRERGRYVATPADIGPVGERPSLSHDPRSATCRVPAVTCERF